MAYEGLSALRAEAFSQALVPNNYKWAWDGLVAAIPGWQTAGGPIDLAAEVVGTLVGAVDYTSSFAGPELLFAASTYVSLGNSTRYSTDLYGSITVACMHTPTTTAQAGLWVYAYDGSGSAPFAFIWSVGSNSQYSFWNDNNVNGPASATVAVGTRSFVIGRRIGTNTASPTLNLFVNGVLTTTTGTTIDGGWNGTGANPIQAINRFGGFAGYMGVGTIGNVLLWNRALSDVEIDALNSDPYGPIRQMRQKWVFATPSTAGITPLAMASYRRRRV